MNFCGFFIIAPTRIECQFLKEMHGFLTSDFGKRRAQEYQIPKTGTGQVMNVLSHPCITLLIRLLTSRCEQTFDVVTQPVLF